MNERITEDMVESSLRTHGYYKNGSGILVEKQISQTPRIQKLLEHASKRGLNVGRPEFLIRSSKYPNFIIVVECKASAQKHESATLDQYAGYAVDGALLYASFLAKEFDVLAIAVSGQTTQTKCISHYLHLKGLPRASKFDAVSDIRSFDEYYDAVIHSDAKFRQDYNELLDYSRTLNNELQSKKVTESERGFLISGVLISLQNEAFKKSYNEHKTSKQLASSMLETIKNEFESAKLPAERRENLTQAFSFIPQSPALINDRTFFTGLIKGIDDNINSFMRTHKYYDTIGHFYVEFLKYANNDKGLGIVLTPPHIAELFTELAGVNRDSVVLDNCCGTAGLLIAAMKTMLKDCKADRALERRVKMRQLIGIEFQPKIYALAVSNMILHGDGKTNILRGDCFAADAAKLTSKLRPTVGLLNPPYKNKTVADDKEELEFVFNNLEALQNGGACVAIVPITCATAPSGGIAQWKAKILERHTLEAVMSMPIELFHNSKTTVVTCVMVFTAGRPHPKGKKTWFGYWRKDGFVKTKHRGRLDDNATWDKIKTSWVNGYRNREISDGISVMREVGATDEWCAEAYLETDYNLLSRHLVLEAAKRYILKSAMLAHSSRSFEEHEN